MIGINWDRGFCERNESSGSMKGRNLTTLVNSASQERLCSMQLVGQFQVRSVGYTPLHTNTLQSSFITSWNLNCRITEFEQLNLGRTDDSQLVRRKTKMSVVSTYPHCPLPKNKVETEKWGTGREKRTRIWSSGQSILHVYLTQPPTESSTFAWDKSVTNTHLNFPWLTTSELCTSPPSHRPNFS
jgi:hypothetical protein